MSVALEILVTTAKVRGYRVESAARDVGWRRDVEGVMADGKLVTLSGLEVVGNKEEIIDRIEAKLRLFPNIRNQL